MICSEMCTLLVEWNRFVVFFAVHDDIFILASVNERVLH